MSILVMIFGAEKISCWESPKISYDLESARLLTKYVQHSLFTVLETTNSKIFPAFCIAVLFKGTKMTWYDTWKTWRPDPSLRIVTDYLLLMLSRFEWFWILEILPDGCLCKALSQDPAGASKSPHQSFKYKKGRRMHVRNWRSKREEAATLKKGSWKKSSLTTVTTSFPQSAEAILSNWNDLNPQRLQYPQSPRLQYSALGLLLNCPRNWSLSQQPVGLSSDGLDFERLSSGCAWVTSEAQTQ